MGFIKIQVILAENVPARPIFAPWRMRKQDYIVSDMTWGTFKRWPQMMNLFRQIWWSKMLKRCCRICGDEFYVPPKQATRAYCDRSSCKQERKRIALVKEKQKYQCVQKGIRKIKSKEKPDHGRKCRRCGCNCYPNYFFCAECHHYVSKSNWQSNKDDEISIAWSLRIKALQVHRLNQMQYDNGAV